MTDDAAERPSPERPSPEPPESAEELGARLVAEVQAAGAARPGQRVLHARGIGAAGQFVSTGAGARFTRAAHLQPEMVTPLVVRFSNGSADPDASDGTRDGRGMATKFRLGDGSSTDIVALSLPMFFVRTTDDFVDFVRARRPDPATGEMDLNKVLAFLGEHPEAQAAAELSIAAPAPVGYDTVRYHSVHVFWLVGADGRRTPVRYRWQPAAGVRGLSDEEAAAQPADYLQSGLASALAAGSVRFDLEIVVGQDGDPTDDATSVWPEDRESLVVGRLELTGLADAEPLIFDPTRVTDGIDCSDDPILHARSAAYGASYAQRTTS
jgi:catalase